nr:MAG TPA: hypothetical protein [Caudoviricetes sp.]
MPKGSQMLVVQAICEENNRVWIEAQAKPACGRSQINYTTHLLRWILVNNFLK